MTSFQRAAVRLLVVASVFGLIATHMWAQQSVHNEMQGKRLEDLDEALR